MKIAVIGGGSTYTPELVSGLSRERDKIGVRQLVLHDIDSERREIVGGLAARMLERQGFEGTLDVTGELDRALDGADFVLLQIRVGGQAARLSDETVPLACGCIGQETTGAGGFGKALRTVPVVLEIAERVRELSSPDAWIVDFTNPVGIVTRSLLDAGHRAVGLCNVAIGFQRSFAKHLGRRAGRGRRRPGRPQPPHLDPRRPGRRSRRASRADGIARRRDRAAGGPAPAPARGARRRPFFLPAVLLLATTPCSPSSSAASRGRRSSPRSSAACSTLYRDPALNEKPALLEQRGGAFYSEAATGLVASLVSTDGVVHEVDIRNEGTLAGLADDDVVEVPARVENGRLVPLPQAPLAPELLGLTQHVAAYERLAAQAAITADPALARKALLAHPLIGQHPLNEELVERLLEAEGAERKALG